MSTADATADETAPSESGGFLGWIERVGNKVPNPSIMFLYLIGLIAVLSAVLSWIGVKVTETVAIPHPTQEVLRSIDQLGGSMALHDLQLNAPVDPQGLPAYTIETITVPVRNLLNGDGIAHIFSSFVANFSGFAPVAVVLIAMVGVGVAEHAGLMASLIRKLVKVAPRSWLPFIIIFVGVLSSVATDAGYLILIPLAASAFAAVGRHPLAGMAGAFAAVGGVFGFNLIPTPSDSMLTEITNETLPGSAEPLDVLANYFFMIVASILLAIVVTYVTTKIIEPRLGTWEPSEGSIVVTEATEGDYDEQADRRGLRWTFWALIASVVGLIALVAPPGAPLRGDDGAIFGPTPFMDSLVFTISLLFLICGAAYGFGSKSFRSKDDVIAGITHAFAGLGGLLLMFLMIAQFIALFNYTQMPMILAGVMANWLESANMPALVLLIVLILVFVLLDFIMPGLVPKWAIFAPIFIPLFYNLGIAPQTVQAAYRVGDSPVNVLTPLMVYMPFIVTVAQRYRKKSGIGTLIALMLPYAAILLGVSTLLFVGWYALGIPWGPGAPVHL
ncbi:AbgT family transporter [Nakamurella lactea]|uniref:AbgT family transporter n=1 Tax=Nakamurella lactea TaxID=459515 RepID=UPI0004003AA4|nr:AbgT family transporter [Nakamurella lactea]